MQFSIIIPAKNEEANIGRCLDSIMNVGWDHSQFEVIVVDNGSSDRTVAIAKEKGALLFIKPELTISALRNFGVTQAKGDVLVFLDADCTVTGDWLQSASRYLSRDDIVCFGSPPTVPEDATWVQTAWYRIRRGKDHCGEVDWLESMNMFVRRETFLAVAGFNEELVTCEDYDLSLRIKPFGKIVADQRIVAVHHGEAATVEHFFRKEYWRGTSNLKGIFHHGFSLKELPSVMLPIVHVILGLIVLSALIAGFMKANDQVVSGGAALLLLWQIPLFLLAVWKNRDDLHLMTALQLYMLLNVYFLARGGAVLRRR
jgi:glycosyltransferase involved in cell wall biosynthesis